MVMSKIHALEKKNVVRAFATKAGLPDTFSSLEIAGLHKVADSEHISERNKQLIFQFLNHISPEVSERRLTFYTHKLCRLALWIKKDFNAVEESDLRSVLTFLSKGNARLDGGRYSQGTIHGYKVTLKRFYRWLEGDDEDYPRKVRWIKTSGDSTRIHEPEQLLSFSEIVELIRHARNERDKALISFLYESGARSSEMLSMRIKHLEFSKNMVKATLPVSKTRPRVVPLVSCRKHLAVWMNYHPCKDNQEAYLWSNMKRDGSEHLTGNTVNEILKRVSNDAKISKRVYPHLFRACSITHKQSAGWPEQAIKVFHGLSKDSKVMKHYSHLSFNDLERIQCKMNRLEIKDREEMNQSIRCPGCGKENPLYVQICECGLPTEVKNVTDGRRAVESEIEARLEKKLEKLLQSRLKYDSFMEQFMQSLLLKAKQSPPLMKAVTEIRHDLGQKNVKIPESNN